VNGGGVHATLMPASPDAAQALGGHMAGLNAYLAEEHTPVETLTLAMPAGRGADAGAPGHGANQDMNQGMSQDMNQSRSYGQGQNAGQDGSSESASNAQPVIQAVSASAPRDLPEVAGRFDPAAGIPRLEGTHISVIA
jgi:hypothetical protein